MRIHFYIPIVALTLCLPLACSTPARRARERPAAFHALPVETQKLVSHRQVRTGLGADAVYIAWGKPDVKTQADRGKETVETWVYERHLTVTEPFGANDQYGPYHGWGSLPVPRELEPGFGFRGFGDEGLFRYQPHVRIIDAEYKRAEFINGKLVRFVDQR